MKDGELVEEHVLRRSLRLEADELPPRLDPVLFAHVARTSDQARRRLAIAVVVAFVGGWVWSEVFRLALVGLSALTGFDPLGATLDALAGLAVAAAPLVTAALSPAIPIAIFAAAVVAALSERTRRIDATASARTQQHQ